MLTLPEILFHIFTFLPIKDWQKTKLVCCLWKEIGDEVFDPSQIRRVYFTSLESVKFLLKDGRSDPGADKNVTIRRASSFGHLEIVKVLLQDPRVNPHDNEDGYSKPIQLASKNGHFEVVELLLQDPRVDPSSQKDKAIGLAAEKGHLKIVERLLQDSRVNPSTFGNYALRMAAMNGHLEVVKFLLQDERVKANAVNSYPLRLAIEKGHLEVVKFLFPRFSSTFFDNGRINSSLNQAACKGYLEIIKFVLQYIDPSEDLIFYASKGGHFGMVRFLLERKWPVRSLRIAGKYAIKYNFLEIFKLIYGVHPEKHYFLSHSLLLGNQEIINLIS